VSENRLKEGRRVICQAHGPHQGKRGNVVEVVGEMVHVEFEASSTFRKRSYFEPVGDVEVSLRETSSRNDSALQSREVDEEAVVE
jgi:hypothetical protein